MITYHTGPLILILAAAVAQLTSIYTLDIYYIQHIYILYILELF